MQNELHDKMEQKYYERQLRYSKKKKENKKENIYVVHIFNTHVYMIVLQDLNSLDTLVDAVTSSIAQEDQSTKV